MTDKERLTELVNHFASGNQQEFANLIGVPRSSIATWMHRDGITANGREAILDTFPQVSRDWLMGRNDCQEQMIVPETIYFTRKEVIPLYEDSRASCGIAELMDNPQYVTDHIHIPGVKGAAALYAEGVSMEPTIHDGDLCIVGDEVRLQDVNSKSIYLIVTSEGLCMFKRIQDEGRQAERLLVISENPDYTPHAQAIDKNEVLHIYPLRHVVHSF